ncbi:hypothetical protein FEP54_00622 [Burkholderia multivorans]|nr:hypothetical protein [Burkholderia multivorans]MDR8921925.1 hypothetical protein [Burkholderia multivorans]MDR8965944.1 hypothetical protein [Burkholderia multivorans]MDR9019581.1 hypothetical protein [Burkholderia multivorans]MDR9029762.1 hypothetical protein [Burkholderia multivorans]
MYDILQGHMVQPRLSISHSRALSWAVTNFPTKNIALLLRFLCSVAIFHSNAAHNALRDEPEDEVNLDYLSEEFVMAVLMAAIDRHYKLGGKNLHEIVMGAIQICIDADRAIENYVKRSECSCRTLQDRSRDL